MHGHKRQFYSEGSVKKEPVHQMTDVGITIDSTLKFNAHIDKIVVKARSRASLIFRTFKSRNRNYFISRLLFMSDHCWSTCSVIWSPHYKYVMEQLEYVQRRFTKHFPGMSCVDLTIIASIALLSAQFAVQNTFHPALKNSIAWLHLRASLWKQISAFIHLYGYVRVFTLLFIAA